MCQLVKTHVQSALIVPVVGIIRVVVLGKYADTKFLTGYLSNTRLIQGM